MEMLMQSFGGLGLFLLGMIVMSEALRSLAGELMRKSLRRFTRNPLSGAITGAVTTAVLQSSSATTVAAVGFVGAGLLTFSESLGIIFGANIGTTITGWMVALIGFKFQLGNLLLPLIFIGVLMRLFANARLASAGMALAGFGLIFVGIGILQQGMGNLQQVITPEFFPADTLIGRLKLVAIGLLITVVTQSSSAGVATALAAVFTGAINFEQAAALVIGMDVGTTVTTAIATIGGSVSSRRTGFSHVIYNLMTALGALVFLNIYVNTWQSISPGALVENAELALVGFHTAFNMLGVIIVLPFTEHFSRLMTKLFPDRADEYTATLNPQLIHESDLALTAALVSIRSELTALLKHLLSMLDDSSREEKINLIDLQTALNETQAYIDQVHLENKTKPDWYVLVSLIHSLDHMQRLHERCEEDVDRALAAKQTPELQQYIHILIKSVKQIVQAIENRNWIDAKNYADQFSGLISKEAREIRHNVMSNVAEGKINVPAGTDRLEAIRWLRRVSAHILRILHHQVKAQKYLSLK